MNIIDVHTHFFPKDMKVNRSKYCSLDRNFSELYGEKRIDIPTEDELSEILNEDPNIKLVIQSIGYQDLELTKYTNDFLIDMSLKYDQVKVFGSININWGVNKCLEEIERMKKKDVSGIGELHPDSQGFDLLNFELFDPIVENLVSNNMILNLHSSEPVGHIYNGKGSMFPGKLYSFAARYQELKIILSHLGGGLPVYYFMPEVKKDLKNVYYDTAATDFLYEPRIVKVFCEILGSEKILFGSDYGLIKIDRAIQNIRNSKLNPVELENVLFKNALNLLSW
tara:strand:+ start:298 stop:1140 length:843 start_codon:yes stop_codon:yes gene_type:complete